MSNAGDFSLVEKEKRICCPYNRSHLIDPLRMVTHLTKCKKSYPEIKMTICPFNATHHIKEENLYKHFEVCEDKDIVEREMFSRKHPNFMENLSKKTGTTLLNDNENVCTGDFPNEDWDSEITPEVKTAFNPQESTIYKPVSRHPPTGLGKSGRNKWREAECERVRRLLEGENVDDLIFPCPTTEGGFITVYEIAHGRKKPQVEPMRERPGRGADNVLPNRPRQSVANQVLGSRTSRAGTALDSDSDSDNGGYVPSRNSFSDCFSSRAMDSLSISGSVSGK